MHGRRWRARGKSNLDEGITRVRPESYKSYQKKVQKRSIHTCNMYQGTKVPKNKKLTIDEGITRVRPKSYKSYYQKKVQKRSMLATSFKVPKRTQRTINKMRG